MTTIRTTPYPQALSPPVAPETGKMAAQRAFFAALTGKTEAAVTEATSPPAAAAPAPSARVSLSAEAPAKTLRPGSIIDIRV